MRFLCFLFILSFHFANAEDLKIGLRADITSIDPHFHVSGPNCAISNHIFEPLIRQDNDQKLVPCLATSWVNISDLIWEFTLRENVRFHKGDLFTAEDVLYTIERIQKGVGPIESFKTYIRFIDKIEILGPHKIRFITLKPYPLLAWDLAMIGIIPHSLGDENRTEIFNQETKLGQNSLGTGPYRFVHWRPGQDIVLVQNTTYWGDKEPWKRIIFKPVPQDISRFNALLAGDFDFTETIPIEEMEDLKAKSNYTLFATMPSRLMYLCLDLGNAISSYIFDLKGEKLTFNPLQNVKIREAMSLAIDRDFLIQHFLGNKGLPAGQLVLKDATGFNPDIKPDEMNLEKAKNLMKEAGFEEGFEIVLSSPSGRYVNDQKIVQAIASMLERIGVRAKVEILPSNIFFSRSQKGDFSLSLGGWPVGRESLSPLQALFHSLDPKEGHGYFNRGRYSNASLDKLIENALETMDDVKREALLKEANRQIVQDRIIIPLYFSVANWAGKSNLTFTPRMDEYTLAMNIRKVTNAP